MKSFLLEPLKKIIQISSQVNLGRFSSSRQRTGVTVVVLVSANPLLQHTQNIVVHRIHSGILQIKKVFSYE